MLGQYAISHAVWGPHETAAPPGRLVERSMTAPGHRPQPRKTGMDYVKPADVAKAMAETGLRKLALPPRALLIRGVLSGAILGVATSLAFTAATSTGQPLVGALVFPVGLIFIVLLGLELITGSFALVPL